MHIIVQSVVIVHRYGQIKTPMNKRSLRILAKELGPKPLSGSCPGVHHFYLRGMQI